MSKPPSSRPPNNRQPANKPPRVIELPRDPRRAAYDALHEVGAQGAYAHIVLPQVLKAYDLEPRDAGLATEIVYGTLRNQGTLDAVLSRCVRRGLDTLDPRVLDVLRMGAYQLLIMKTDDYAAVNTSVNLVRDVAGEGPAGLVNAVLRATSRRTLDQWFEAFAVDDGVETDNYLSVRYSHPRWIISALRDSLGPQRRDELIALLEKNNEAPSVTLVARPGRSDLRELIDDGATAGRWSPLAAIAPGGKVGQIKAVREGRAGVQDEGSQLIALALANAPVEGDDKRWLDLCAGPGGKIALLAALAAQRDAGIVGVELHEHRARLVEQAVGDSEGFDGVVVGDGRKPPVDGLFDRVLVDAPCTGLGVLRRRPESRWRRSPSDIPELTKLQTGLLNAAIEITRPGGVIAYVTCSPHVAETAMIVGPIVKKRGDVELEDARDLFPGVPDLGDGPYVRLWPQVHGTDGMFFALMRRT